MRVGPVTRACRHTTKMALRELVLHHGHVRVHKKGLAKRRAPHTVSFDSMRKQRPRGSITRQTVVEAALAVVDEHGLEGMTIRRVAERAGAPPMSLYSHFANKDGLLDLMYMEVSRRMYRDQGYDAWQTEMLALFQRIHGILLSHPNWAPLLSRPAPPIAVPLRERLLQMMTAEGATSEHAFQALSSVVLVSIGFTLVELTYKSPQGRSTLEERFERLRDWAGTRDADSHATTRDAVSKLAHFGLDEVFEFTAQTLIGGIDLSPRQRKTGR